MKAVLQKKVYVSCGSLQQRQQVRATKSTLIETCKEKAKEVTSNTKRSENNNQAGMKKRRRISFIPRKKDEIRPFILYLDRLNQRLTLKTLA
jgi:hypothetical protein